MNLVPPADLELPFTHKSPWTNKRQDFNRAEHLEGEVYPSHVTGIVI